MKKDVKNKSAEPISIHHKQEKLKEESPRKIIGIADFITENTEQIVEEWEKFARTLLPASNNLTPLALRDHIREILSFIVKDIKSPQTHREQIIKSKGEKRRSSAPTAAEIHAALRLAGGFDIDQMLSEWRALRASIIKLWSKANTGAQMGFEDILEMTRFNESIDQALAESARHYTNNVSYSKDLFVSILSHDLRIPLNVILMSSNLQLSITSHEERLNMLASQIHESVSRAIQIVDGLLEVTHARFGSGFPVSRAPMDMSFVCRQIVEEMRSFHPTRTIILKVSGDLKGEWDKSRIAQVLSNLISNAIHYSFKDAPVVITLEGTRKEAILSVHNEGVPIRIEKQETIFESFTSGDEDKPPSKFRLGLGLYITKEIVLAHGGTIDLISSEDKGTTITVKLPKIVMPKIIK